MIKNVRSNILKLLSIYKFMLKTLHEYIYEILLYKWHAKKAAHGGHSYSPCAPFSKLYVNCLLQVHWSILKLLNYYISWQIYYLYLSIILRPWGVETSYKNCLRFTVSVSFQLWYLSWMSLIKSLLTLSYVSLMLNIMFFLPTLTSTCGF